MVARRGRPRNPDVDLPRRQDHRDAGQIRRPRPLPQSAEAALIVSSARRRPRSLMAKKSAKPKSRPPRPDKMPGPIQYKKATGDSEPSMLEIASMRKKK